jgi:hypothetical protein
MQHKKRGSRRGGGGGPSKRRAGAGGQLVDRLPVGREDNCDGPSEEYEGDEDDSYADGSDDVSSCKRHKEPAVLTAFAAVITDVSRGLRMNAMPCSKALLLLRELYTCAGQTRHCPGSCFCGPDYLRVMCCNASLPHVQSFIADSDDERVPGGAGGSQEPANELDDLRPWAFDPDREHEPAGEHFAQVF